MYKVQKDLYGFKQDPRVYYKRINDKIIKMMLHFMCKHFLMMEWIRMMLHFLEV